MYFPIWLETFFILTFMLKSRVHISLLVKFGPLIMNFFCDFNQSIFKLEGNSSFTCPSLHQSHTDLTVSFAASGTVADPFFFFLQLHMMIAKM